MRLRGGETAVGSSKDYCSFCRQQLNFRADRISRRINHTRLPCDRREMCRDHFDQPSLTCDAVQSDITEAPRPPRPSRQPSEAIRMPQLTNTVKAEVSS